jgi:hypothetical protein
MSGGKDGPIPVAIIGAAGVIIAALIGVWATNRTHTDSPAIPNSGTSPADIVKARFENSYSPVGGFVDCPCIAYTKDEKGLTVTNNCSGPVSMMCVKDTDATVPPGWDLIAIIPGRKFAQVQLQAKHRVFFDADGMVNNRGACQFYSCPGTSNQPRALRCQAGVLQPPPVAACFQNSGLVGQPCTCPNGVIGILTQ